MNIKINDINKEIKLITLENNNKVIVELLSYGACLKSVSIPYKDGRRTITQTFTEIDEYIKNNTAYCGKTLGPNAGRITSSVGIDLKNGVVLHPTKNEKDTNNLHGGFSSVSTKNWDIKNTSSDGNKVEVTFTTSQEDGVDGYSGNREYSVTYSLDNENNILIKLNATTDKDTYMNMSNHSYWNLNGNSDEGLDQHFKVYAHSIVFNAVDGGVPEKLVDINKIENEENISFTNDSLLKDLQIYDKNSEYSKQINMGNGLNSGFVFNDHTIKDLLCSLSSKNKDIVLETYSNAPAMVAYSSGSMDEGKPLENGQVSKKSCSIALEFQELPSVQETTILKANTQFSRTIIFRVIFD